MRTLAYWGRYACMFGLVALGLIAASVLFCVIAALSLLEDWIRG